MDVDIKATGRSTGPPTISQDLNDDSRTAVRCDQFVNHGSHSATPSRDLSPGVNRQSPRSKDFEFVLVTDNQSRRQVRRHAMRQHMRQRRMDGIARLETPHTPIGGWVVREAPNPLPLHSPARAGSIQDTSHVNSDIIAIDEEQPEVAPETESHPLVSSPKKTKRKDDSTLPATLCGLSSPRPSPGLGGIGDPFDSYPITIPQADHELIEHCKCSSRSGLFPYI